MASPNPSTPCIFCKIIKGEIPCFKVAETDKIIAFLDINPVNPGDTLVLSKEHHANLLDTPDESLSDIMAMCKKVAAAVMDELGADGINVGMNNLPAAGQEIMHAHIHVIPRFKNDGLRHWGQRPYQEGQAAQIAKRLSQKLR